MRLGVAGLGFMGATHLKAIRSLPGVTLSAVCSSDETKLAGDLSQVGGNIGAGDRFDFSGVKRLRSLADLIADPDIDAVDLCLPTDLHESASIAALQAGKHVLVEKPMALHPAACARMIEASRASGKVLMVAHVLRFFPVYTALIQAAGDVGPIREAAFRRRCAMPGWGGWLKERQRSGGGVFDLLIHDVDLCLRLMGAPEFVSATGHEDFARGIDIIDARFHFAGGAMASVRGGWYPGEFPFSMEYSICGDDGAIEYSSAGQAPALYSRGGTRVLPLDTADGYAAEIEYFASCCDAGMAPSRCPPAESSEAVRIAALMRDARKFKGEKVSCK